MIAASTWQRHRQTVVNQHWTADRVGVLTAHLQTAIDETQAYDVLARHLPEMGIQFAAVALFDQAGDDPETCCHLRTITPPGEATIHFPCHQFPPQGLLPIDHPFSLALLPLVNPRGQLGFVVFDSHQLDLYGAIVQQLAAALNTAQLYREATEGRRLAEEANRMKSRFLSTVSHELRTPLNLIVGLGEILLRDSDRGDVPLPPTARNDVERLNANAQHLGRLIGDVLDLASSDAGQLRLTNQLVDLGTGPAHHGGDRPQVGGGQRVRLARRPARVGAVGLGRPHPPVAGGAEPHQQRDQIHGARRSLPDAGV